MTSLLIKDESTADTMIECPSIEPIPVPPTTPEQTTKRKYDGDLDQPTKTPTSSVFSRLFGPRKKSITSEDFTRVWQKLEERKEYYKGITDKLQAEAKPKDALITDLNQEIKDLKEELRQARKKNVDMFLAMERFSTDFMVDFHEDIADALAEEETVIEASEHRFC